MTLQKDINEIIKKNLPEQVAGELKEVLEKYENLKIENKRIIEERQDLTHRNSNLCAENHKLREREKDVEEKAGRLELIKEELQNREIKLNETILEIKLENAENTNNKIIELVNALMRNTVYRKNAFPITNIESKYDENCNFYSETQVQGENTETIAE